MLRWNPCKRLSAADCLKRDLRKLSLCDARCKAANEGQAEVGAILFNDENVNCQYSFPPRVRISQLTVQGKASHYLKSHP
jgi:hypothetical protein